MTNRQLLPALFLLALAAPALAAAPPAGESGCIACHSNATTMKEAGYPHFTVTNAEVEAQSGMTADCQDCHRGDPQARDKEKAHTGLGRLLVVRKKGLTAEPVERRHPLYFGEGGMGRIRYVADKDGKGVFDSTVTTILWQDKRPDTLSQNFTMMKQTCGACHPREFAQFTTSTMGRNAKQSSYRSWTDAARGPHNCGVWFAGNYDRIAANTAVPFSAAVNDLNQRACNSCHVGCLDCHYDPQPASTTDPKLGMHTFNRTPKPESCYGGGRGSLCHAGPEDRRRGAGYFGSSFSHPEGAEPDIHLAKKVGCLDCHESSRDGKLSHAMVKRQATCDRCHAAIVKSHGSSVHRHLACEACHIRNVGGYQGTFWGPGKLAGSPTPFLKYKEYYGIMTDPILIRDQRGRWIPVKPFPMAVMNVKTADFKPGLYWRWPGTLPDLQRTDDAWGYVGLFDGLPENNKALLWIQIDKLSHKYGPARSCDSCHGTPDGEQRQLVSWDYAGPGALPFSGSHTVIANSHGLFIRDMKATDSVEPTTGNTISSFAPWIYLKDRWSIPGNFAVPLPKDRAGYERLKGNRPQAIATGIVHR